MILSIGFTESYAATQNIEVIKFTEFKYDEITDLEMLYFLENRYLIVKNDGKQGVINIEGKEIVPPKYENLNIYSDEDFTDGGIVVELNEKYGAFDLEGNELVPLGLYDTIYPQLTNDLLLVKNNNHHSGSYKWGYIDREGNEVIPFEYSSANSFSEGYATVSAGDVDGFIDIMGNFTKLEYDYLGQKFSSGLLAVKNYLDTGRKDEYGIIRDELWGFVDTKGELVIPLKYDNIRNDRYMDGFVIYEVDGKYGFLNADGNEITPAKYDYVDYFTDGLAPVIINDKLGFINESGTEVSPLKYDIASFGGSYDTYGATNFNGRDYLNVSVNHKYGIINKEGKEIIAPKYDNSFYFRDGYATVSVNGRYGLIDRSGNEVVPLIYDYVWSSFDDGLALVELDGKDGFINKNFELVIPIEFNANLFCNGFANVYSNGKYGFINTSGELVIPYQYSFVRDFRNGLCIVRHYGQEDNTCIDETGKQVIPTEYDCHWVNSDGSIIVDLNGEYGCIDTNGNITIPFIYDWIDTFDNGLVYAELNGKSGLLDIEGNQLTEFTYDINSMLSSTDDGQGGYYYKGSIDGKYGIIKILKTEAIPLIQATPNSSKVLIDGIEVEFEAYGINGHNYFKLRDIAMALNGSSKDFQVDWDSTNNSVKITSGTMYTPVGGELTISDKLLTKTATPTSSKIYIDNEEKSFFVYGIDGYNYFKLRDLGKALNFGVTWDGVNNTIRINTEIGYN